MATKEELIQFVAAKLPDTGSVELEPADIRECFTEILEHWDVGTPGTGGTGWSPQLTVAADAARRVLQIIDWTGGTGTKPAIGYVGASGIVQDIAQAVDIRGPQGLQGLKGDQGDKGDKGDPADGISLASTDELEEGQANLYFTPARAQQAVTGSANASPRGTDIVILVDPHTGAFTHTTAAQLLVSLISKVAGNVRAEFNGENVRLDMAWTGVFVSPDLIPDVPGQAMTQKRTSERFVNKTQYQADIAALTELILNPPAPGPATIPGLTLWLKADTGVTEVGGGVDAWEDQSSVGNNYVADNAGTRALVTANAVNGFPAITANGGRSMTGNTLFGMTDNVTCFAVMRHDTAANAGYWGQILAHGTGFNNNDAMLFAGTPGHGEPYLHVHGGNRLGSSAPPSGFHIAGFASEYNVRKSVRVNEVVDNYTVGLTYTSNAPFTNSTLFTPTVETGFIGDLAELIVYTKILSSTETDVVMNYLKTKYAL